MAAVVAGARSPARASRSHTNGGERERDPSTAERRKIRNRANNNRLKELRSARAWTQEHIAEKLAITRQTVIALEKGRSFPSLELAFRIAELFDRRVEEVFDPLGGGLSPLEGNGDSGHRPRGNGAGHT